jgi:hypothetical protein
MSRSRATSATTCSARSSSLATDILPPPPSARQNYAIFVQQNPGLRAADARGAVVDHITARRLAI